MITTVATRTIGDAVQSEPGYREIEVVEGSYLRTMVQGTVMLRERLGGVRHIVVRIHGHGNYRTVLSVVLDKSAFDTDPDVDWEGALFQECREQC